jgi:GTPase SAR1 family protein
MRLLIHNKPKLKMPEFKVDEPLSKHLEDDPLLSNMNKSFCCGLIGKAGSGKTSLMVSFLQTPKKFKKVFNKIYVFMPNSSRNSMKNKIFDVLL